MYKKLLAALFLGFVLAGSVSAQEIEVDRYNITARVDLAGSALDARASLEISNVGSTPKDRLYLKLTKLAKISAATINGVAARVDSTEDRRVIALNQVTLTPDTAIAPGTKAKVEITYRLEVPESTATASITSGEVLMAPEAIWFPTPSTMFVMYGGVTAPFTLTVNGPANVPGFRAASAGVLKSDAGQTFSFDEPLNSLPFFVAGAFERPVSSEHGGVKIDIYLQPGLTSAADSKAPAAGLPVAARLRDEAGRIIDFFAKMLGPPASGASLSIISSSRTGNLSVPGALVLSEQTFRREAVNAVTLELLADAIARLWTEGRVRIRGQESRSAQADRPGQRARSTALLRDSLPRYLAALYFEERFGADAAREAFRRMRAGYTPIAKTSRDAELGVQTVLSPTYGAAAFAKGPLVLRLLAESGGRDKFIAALKVLFAGAQTKIITNDDFRKELAKATSPEVDKLFQQWVESIIEPDLVVGVPQPADKPGLLRVNVRNLGTGEVTAQVLAVTTSGKQLKVSVAVPSEDLTSTDIQSDEKIVSIEIDPEKLIIQTDYDNDAKPTRIWAQTLFNESLASFNKGDYQNAETKLREAVRSSPSCSQYHAWLARTLAVEKKYDDAVSEANAAIKIEPPTGSAIAWAYITLGQIALGRNQAAEAVQSLRKGLAEAEEAPAQFLARETLATAERGGGSAPAVEESIKSVVQQLDTLIKQPTSDKVFTVIVRNNLKRFVQGLSLAPPTEWTTEILRVDQIDANRVALDVSLKVKAGGRDQAGTAVLVLHRASSGWTLESVDLFNVK